MGKGSKPRVPSISQTEYAQKHKKIFNKPKNDCSTCGSIEVSSYCKDCSGFDRWYKQNVASIGAMFGDDINADGEGVA